MPHPHSVRTVPLFSSPNASGAGPESTLAADRLERLAELVADGRVPFPLDLSPVDAARLAHAVRARSADRLVDYIAQAIAADLAASRAPQGDGDVEAEV